METINLRDNISVFGFEVKSFPNGIQEAFDALSRLVPDGIDRNFYGISYVEAGNIKYHAVMDELNPGEAERFNCRRYTIACGEYSAVRVQEWKKKIHTIQDIFKNMLGDECPVESHPVIEWYLNDNEMVCLARTIEDPVTSSS